MKFTFLLLGLLTLNICFSQTSIDTTKANALEEIELNSFRYLKSKKNSQQLSTISKQEIEFQNGQTSADILANSGKVTVQKSQQGGGSPIIRGFEASRILLLVDGVRMNNLIFRSGHLQNIINVDENMLENIDVLFGPSSTAFGSDALGGAINMITKKPYLLSETHNKRFSGSVNSRYSTVNNEKTSHLDLSFSSKKWATISSFSYNEFGDLKMGSRKNGKNEFFGERPFYIESTNNEDQIVANGNALIQRFSGYKQYNVMQKILFEPSENIEHSLNLQYSTTSDIPRYDRLTDVNSQGVLRNAVWNYGPQKRLLAGYKYLKLEVYRNTDMNVGANYQNFEESRINRPFKNLNENSRIEKVNIYSFNIDLKTRIGKRDLVYGAEVFYDDLNSTATKKNILTNINIPTDTRYPNGKNATLRSDLFATFFDQLNDKTSLNFGARFGFINLKSTIEDNSFFSFPFTEINQKNTTYSGSAGIVNNPTKNIKVSFNLASGFRVPNIDDLGKIFESSAGKLIVPNSEIKPEKTITGDINFTLSENKIFEFENTLFYTRMFDAIVTDKFLFNGQNTIIYNNELSTILSNQNIGKATIFGYATALNITIFKPLNFYGTFNFTYGRSQDNRNKKPLDHIPPINGKTGLNFQNKWFNFDLYMLYNGKKDLNDYSDSGEDNLQYATKEGTPAWESYNFKTAVTAIKNLTIFSGIENILDIQYRTFSSGINAPGKNIYLGAKYQL